MPNMSSVAWLSKICSKLQVPTSHLSEIDDLLDKHQVKKVLCENISTLIYLQL